MGEAQFMFLLLKTVIAQSCRPDILVDDFAKITTGRLPDDSDIKQFNLLGGDYGSAGAAFRIDTLAKSMSITAGSANIGQPEPWANPGTAPTINYWFAKFDRVACFDLSGYSAVAFDLVAPAGSNMNFTMTQRSADCQSRLVDSVYRPLSSYVTPNGQKQTVVLPFADFSKTLVGGQFDFKHLKDWTAVNLVPFGARFTISNLVLRGNCIPTPTATPTAEPTASAKNSALALGAFAACVLLLQ
jgi:hypothetical protein